MIRKTYFSDGTVDSVTHNGTELFFATEDKNGLGQYMGYNLADGVNIEKYYNHGFITRIHGGGIQDLNMEYDYSTGNMKYRWDKTKGLKESFQYDELNRLISAGVEPVDMFGTPTGFAPDAVIYEYDGSMGCTRGNLSVKTDIGQFGYGTYSVANAKSLDYPTPVNAPPLSISSEEQKISYTTFLKAQRITERVNGDDMELVYEYGPELQRTRSLLKRNGTLETTRVYLGNYEVQTTNGTIELIHYVTGGDGLCAIIVQSNGATNIHALYTDHLGSIVGVTKASDGSVVAEQSFDPWGRDRKVTAWWVYEDNPSLPTWLYLGYTGHEHVRPFALINMNARMYDPLNGRMLGPDNYVQGSFATQGFNRFNYAMNNPLKYTDPTGDIPVICEAIIIGAIMGGFTNWAINGGQMTWQGLGHFGVGAVAGGVAGGVGVALGAALGTTAGFINGFIIGAVAGTASGALGGFGNGLLAGEGLGSSLNRGWRGAKTGFITGGVIGGVSGGVYSIKRGGNFFTAVGMRHAFPASIQVEGTTDPVNYSNASAREFSDQYVGTPSGLRNLYADGSAPPGEKMVGDLLTYGGETAQGITEYKGNGVSDVWLARSAFSSKEQLFIVMKHEYLHVGYNSMGLMSQKRQEAGAREWMLHQGKAWGFKVDALQQYYDITFKSLSPKYHYSVLDIQILPTVPW